MTAIEFTHQIAGLRGTLQTFTRRFTHDKDESLDLVQDTILKALTYRDKFRQDTNLKGWLFTILRSTLSFLKIFQDGLLLSGSKSCGYIKAFARKHSADSLENPSQWQLASSGEVSRKLLISLQLLLNFFSRVENSVLYRADGNAKMISNLMVFISCCMHLEGSK